MVDYFVRFLNLRDESPDKSSRRRANDYVQRSASPTVPLLIKYSCLCLLLESCFVRLREASERIYVCELLYFCCGISLKIFHFPFVRFVLVIIKLLNNLRSVFPLCLVCHWRDCLYIRVPIVFLVCHWRDCLYIKVPIVFYSLQILTLIVSPSIFYCVFSRLHFFVIELDKIKPSSLLWK